MIILFKLVSLFCKLSLKKLLNKGGKKAIFFFIFINYNEK